MSIVFSIDSLMFAVKTSKVRAKITQLFKIRAIFDEKMIKYDVFDEKTIDLYSFWLSFLCLKLTLSILKELSPTLDTRQKATSFY